MCNHLKSAASAFTLFALLIGLFGELGGQACADPDDMHWPTNGVTATMDSGAAGAMVTIG